MKPVNVWVMIWGGDSVNENMILECLEILIKMTVVFLSCVVTMGWVKSLK